MNEKQTKNERKTNEKWTKMKGEEVKNVLKEQKTGGKIGKVKKE